MSRLLLGLALVATVSAQPRRYVADCRVLNDTYRVSIESDRPFRESPVVTVRVSKDFSEAFGRDARTPIAQPGADRTTKEPGVPIGITIWPKNDGTVGARAVELAPTSIASTGHSTDGLTATFDGASLPDRFDVVIVSAGGFPQQTCHADLRPPTTGDRVLTDPAPNAARRIFVDASRDGRPWWAPQKDRLDLAEPHQGKALADFLRRGGNAVDEAPTGMHITPEALAGHAIAIRASAGEYSDEELSAYRDFVAGGGRLLLLSWGLPRGRSDSLASAFGLRVGGLVRPRKVTMPPSTPEVDKFAPHAITANVDGAFRYNGSAIIEAPAGFTVLGSVSTGAYADLNYNGRPDADEPQRVDVWGVMEFGKGKVLLFGDMDTFDRVPQPLTRNVFDFLADH